MSSPRLRKSSQVGTEMMLPVDPVCQPLEGGAGRTLRSPVPPLIRTLGRELVEAFVDGDTQRYADACAVVHRLLPPVEHKERHHVIDYNLTPEKIKYMRRMYGKGMRVSEIARLLALPHNVVWSAVTGRTYKHVGD